MLSAVAVEPTTSVKTAVISLRSSLGASASTSGEPQARQNFAIGGFSWPQLAQTAIDRESPAAALRDSRGERRYGSASLRVIADPAIPTPGVVPGRSPAA